MILSTPEFSYGRLHPFGKEAVREGLANASRHMSRIASSISVGACSPAQAAPAAALSTKVRMQRTASLKLCPSLGTEHGGTECGAVRNTRQSMQHATCGNFRYGTRSCARGAMSGCWWLEAHRWLGEPAGQPRSHLDFACLLRPCCAAGMCTHTRLPGTCMMPHSMQNMHTIKSSLIPP